MVTRRLVVHPVAGRTHARATVIAIATYLGKGDVSESAIADFAIASVDQNERDYATLVQAAKKGRIKAQEGL